MVPQIIGVIDGVKSLIYMRKYFRVSHSLEVLMTGGRP